MRSRTTSASGGPLRSAPRGPSRPWRFLGGRLRGRRSCTRWRGPRGRGRSRILRAATRTRVFRVSTHVAISRRGNGGERESANSPVIPVESLSISPGFTISIVLELRWFRECFVSGAVVVVVGALRNISSARSSLVLFTSGVMTTHLAHSVLKTPCIPPTRFHE